MNKNIIITGAAGQDGYYLSKQLIEKGYNVIGIDQWQTKGYNKELKELMRMDNFKLIEGDITDKHFIKRIIIEYMPKWFFNTAAISHVGVSFQIPERVTEVNYLAVINIIENIRSYSPATGFLQCSTSEQFGDNKETPQNELSAMMPNSPYAIAKASAYYFTRLYRKYGIKTYNTICFNHESEIRPETFVTRKITKGIVDIMKGEQDKLVLGNIDTFRDWGYAPDYTEFMIKVMESEKPDDYVIVTGETHTVREFIEEVCDVADIEIEWKGEGVDEIGYLNGEPKIFISREFYRPAEVEKLHGDYSKAKEKIGWEPKTKFKDLVRIMYEADFNGSDS